MLSALSLALIPQSDANASLFGSAPSKKQKPVVKQDGADDERSNECMKGVTFYGDYLYMKAIQDGLKYAQLVPQNSTITPISRSLEQKFDYNSGFRIGTSYSLPHKRWDLDLNWMSFNSSPNAVTAKSHNHGILAAVALPVYALTQNSLVNYVRGKWEMDLNTVELDLQIHLSLGKKFTLTPLGGVKAGWVDQEVKVRYEDFLIVQPTANTPQRMKGHNNMWGVGPMIGIDARFILPADFGIFFTWKVSALAGSFSLKSTYKDFLHTSSHAKLVLKSSERRLAMVQELQAGMNKIWSITRKGRVRSRIQIAAGWETQIWSRQWRLNLFDTFIEPSDGADLTLYGLFARAGVSF